MNKATVDEKGTERRAAERYSIEREVRWRLQGKRTREAPATGRTANISSAGVLFTTVSPVAAGGLVEVAISWPASPGADGELQLVARGRVVRSADGHAAVEFRERKFQSRHSQL